MSMSSIYGSEYESTMDLGGHECDLPLFVVRELENSESNKRYQFR